MAEQLTKEKVLELAVKFMNMTVEKGASPTEAATAAAMLQSLLHRHQLELFEVEESLRKKQFPVGEEEFTSAWKDVPDYAKHLCQTICEAFQVSLLWQKCYGCGEKSIFIGQELDAAVAKYLYLRTCDELLEMAKRKGQAFGYTRSALSDYRASFICGAAAEIGKRLREQRENTQKTTKLGALIVLKNELARDYIGEKYGKTESIRIKVSRGDGHREGREAGKNIDLSMTGLDHEVRREEKEVVGHLS